MWQVMTAGLLFGLVSSFHCIGMCGPLMLALPVHVLPINRQKTALVLYHTGRLTMYSLLGAIFGFAGRHIFMAGFQRSLSISIGILLIVIIAISKFLPSGFANNNFFLSAIKKYIVRLWGKASVFNFLLLGGLNGLLPCGLVYFALATSLSFGSFFSGILYMFCFGLGTLALLGWVHYFGSNFISLSTRNTFRKIIPLFIVSAGALLIVRGLNLGIPFLSPYIGTSPSAAVSCH